MRKPHARRNLLASLWNMCCYVSTRTQFVHASNRPTCCFRTSGPCLLQFGVAFQHECFHHLEANDKALQSTAERWTMYSFMNSFAFSKSFTWLIATFPKICHFFLVAKMASHTCFITSFWWPLSWHPQVNPIETPQESLLRCALMGLMFNFNMAEQRCEIQRPRQTRFVDDQKFIDPRR